MKLDIQVPENMDELIAQAMLNSMLSEKIQEAVEKIAGDIVSNDYNSPVRQAIEHMSRDILEGMLYSDENRKILEDAILAAFQSDKFKEFLAEKVVRKLREY